eukprot:TRINITY_DN82036_c0_g1_i1.p1 TRINITY_DN82036_c0_g1~~TRINITY_DN82036_c0_g1_i1.p1  ORF type:complete len:364 (+),score=92.55 TRINITY_DN82036_c0_g1_i1:78-1169(+)
MERLLIFLCLACAEGASIWTGEWPESDLGPKTPERTNAGKRASKYLSCDVCQVQLMGLLLEHNQSAFEEDRGRLDEWLATDELEEVLEDSGKLCDVQKLMHNVFFFGGEFKTNPDGTAALVLTGGDVESQWQQRGDAEEVYNWKVLAMHTSCQETFRQDSTKIAKGLKKGWKASSGEDWTRRLFAAGRAGCTRARACTVQAAEGQIAAARAARAKKHLERDPSYSPRQSGKTDKGKLLEYDAGIDYYKVLGVDEFASAKDAARAVKHLALLYNSKQGRDLAGIAKEDAAKIMKQLKTAQALLSDPKLRQEYDSDRDRKRIEIGFGLREPKADKEAFDAAAALLAYEEEFEELATDSASKISEL